MLPPSRQAVIPYGSQQLLAMRVSHKLREREGEREREREKEKRQRKDKFRMGFFSSSHKQIFVKKVISLLFGFVLVGQKVRQPRLPERLVT